MNVAVTFWIEGECIGFNSRDIKLAKLATKIAGASWRSLIEFDDTRL